MMRLIDIVQSVPPKAGANVLNNILVLCPSPFTAPNVSGVDALHTSTIMAVNAVAKITLFNTKRSVSTLQNNAPCGKMREQAGMARYNGMATRIEALIQSKDPNTRPRVGYTNKV